MKVERDLPLLPRDRYRVVALISIHLKLLIRCPNREFLWSNLIQNSLLRGKSRKIGKLNKRHYDHVFIIEIQVLAKFHEELMIFDEIKGHLVILPF